jgi:hypothetical protein
MLIEGKQRRKQSKQSATCTDSGEGPRPTLGESGRERRTRPPRPQIDGGRDRRGRVHQGRIQNNRQEKHGDHRVLSCDFNPPLENTCVERKPVSLSILRFFCAF